MGRMNDLAILSSEALDAAVDRFLSWKLPKTFSPDAGISFNPAPEQQYAGLQWPIGTNLLTAIEAKQMLQHCLAPAVEAQAQADATYNSPAYRTFKADEAQELNMFLASDQYNAGYKQCVADFLAGKVYDVDKECAMPLPDIPLVLELRAVKANTPEGVKGWKDIRAGAQVMVESFNTIMDRHQGKLIPDDPT